MAFYGRILMKIIRGSVLLSLACLGLFGGLVAVDDLDNIIDTPRSSGKTVAYLSCAKKTNKKVKKQLRSYKKVDVVAVDAKDAKPAKFTLKKKDVDLNIGGLTKIEYYNDHASRLFESEMLMIPGISDWLFKSFSCCSHYKCSLYLILSKSNAFPAASRELGARPANSGLCL